MVFFNVFHLMQYLFIVTHCKLPCLYMSHTAHVTVYLSLWATADDRGNGNGKGKGLMESSGFMDALQLVTLAAKTKEKKQKKSGKSNAGAGVCGT